MTEYDPRNGKQYGAAWRAVHQLLIHADKPTDWVTVKETARRASGIKSKSAQSLVADLRRHGWIEKVRGGYVLTEKGRVRA